MLCVIGSNQSYLLSHRDGEPTSSRLGEPHGEGRGGVQVGDVYITIRFWYRPVGITGHLCLGVGIRGPTGAGADRTRRRAPATAEWDDKNLLRFSQTGSYERSPPVILNGTSLKVLWPMVGKL